MRNPFKSSKESIMSNVVDRCWNSKHVSKVRAAAVGICDPDKIFYEDEIKAVDALVYNISQSFPHKCGSKEVPGYQMSILLTRDLVAGMDVEESAPLFMDVVGIGHKECNDGIALHIAINARKMFIFSGAGVQRILTDSRLDNILDEMKPNLRERKYSASCIAGVKQVREYLASGVDYWELITTYLSYLAFIAIGCFILLGIYWEWKAKRDREREENETWEALRARFIQIERMRQQMARNANNEGGEGDADSGNQFNQPYCPICWEEFKLNDAGDTELVLQTCKHRFHVQCLDGWFAESGNTSCPVCKTEVFTNRRGGGGDDNDNDNDNDGNADPNIPRNNDRNAHNRGDGMFGLGGAGGLRNRGFRPGFFYDDNNEGSVLRGVHNAVRGVNLALDIDYLLRGLQRNRRFTGIMTDDFVNETARAARQTPPDRGFFGFGGHGVAANRAPNAPVQQVFDRFRTQARQQFLLNEQLIAEAARARSRGGGRSSFGGGSSSGGSGRGSSW